ncbi:MAG TPA: SRPBCC family protein [Aquaticitalea sp.]|nr:SRPBCC family protein [Aquaticitalea sp.]HNU60433.1 SRPBCC family protein [Aquaticitalea sp.]
MTYSSEIIVNVPLRKFIKLFDNVENMKHWQDGLVDIEHLSGDPGMVGAKMKLTYANGTRKMVLIETVTHNKLPREFHGTYTADGLVNNIENHFVELPNGSTKWTTICNYLPLNFKMRAMLGLMPNAFKKQTMKYMKNFKNFAENGQSVSNA